MATATGEIDLSTPAGRMTARTLGAAATTKAASARTTRNPRLTRENYSAAVSTIMSPSAIKSVIFCTSSAAGSCSGGRTYDHAQITGIAAAHVGYELLSSLAARTGR
jgi:hypothetical protein